MKDLIFLSLNVCTVLKLIFLFLFLGAPNAEIFEKISDVTRSFTIYGKVCLLQYYFQW